MLKGSMSYVQRDWIHEMEAAQRVNSIEMQHYVRKMDEFKDKFGNPLDEFRASEVAAILGYERAESVYELAESGKIGYLSRGTGKHRFYIFPRASLMRYLQKYCNRI